MTCDAHCEARGTGKLGATGTRTCRCLCQLPVCVGARPEQAPRGGRMSWLRCERCKSWRTRAMLPLQQAMVLTWQQSPQHLPHLHLHSQQRQPQQPPHTHSGRVRMCHLSSDEPSSRTRSTSLLPHIARQSNSRVQKLGRSSWAFFADFAPAVIPYSSHMQQHAGRPSTPRPASLPKSSCASHEATTSSKIVSAPCGPAGAGWPGASSGPLVDRLTSKPQRGTQQHSSSGVPEWVGPPGARMSARGKKQARGKAHRRGRPRHAARALRATRQKPAEVSGQRRWPRMAQPREPSLDKHGSPPESAYSYTCLLRGPAGKGRRGGAWRRARPVPGPSSVFFVLPGETASSPLRRAPCAPGRSLLTCSTQTWRRWFA